MINSLGRALCYALCGDPNGELNLWFSNVYSFYNLVAKVKNRHLSPLFKSVYYSKNMLPAHLNHCPGKKLNVDWILEETGKQGGGPEKTFECLFNHLDGCQCHWEGSPSASLVAVLPAVTAPYCLAGRGGALPEARQVSECRSEAHSVPFREFLQFYFLTSNLAQEENMWSYSAISIFTYR